ncbi:MAG: leucine-rich repeat domain-containing protein [Bacilli bacterium]|jgi:hypothetical protein
MKKNQTMLLVALTALFLSSCSCSPIAPSSESSEEAVTSETTSEFTTETTSEPSTETTSESSTETTSDSSSDPSSESPSDPQATYTVSWLNCDGTLLKTHNHVPEGTIPVYDGETPHQNEDESYVYQFYGWDPVPEPIYSNMQYFASYLPLEKNTVVDLTGFVFSENDEGLVLVGYYGSAESLYIPDTIASKPIVSIEKSAFYQNPTLREIRLPSGLKTIGDHAFSGCLSLESLTLPMNVKVIEDEAFSACPNLVAISFPNGLEKVGKALIKESPQVHKTVYEKGLYLGNNENEHLIFLGLDASFEQEHLSLHPNTHLIADSACYQKAVTGVSFGPHLQTIGEYAFGSCSHITTLDFPQSLRVIKACAFQMCSGLTTVSFGNQLQKIACCAFAYCALLADVVLPSSLRVLEQAAFTKGWDGSPIPCNEYDNGHYLKSATNDYFALIGSTSATITNMEIHPNTQIIADQALVYHSNLTSIEIPAQVKYLGKLVFAFCSGLTSIKVASTNTTFVDDHQKAVLEKSTGRLICGLTNGDIPEGTKILGAFCFATHDLSAGLVIPASVVEIEDSAFYGAKLPENIEIPHSVTRIGVGVFEEAEAVQTVALPNQIKCIANNMFNSCSTLREITLPETVTSIGESAFGTCRNLTTVNFGSQVRHIKEYAFSGCKKYANFTLPHSLQVIEESAFRSCPLITSLEIGENIHHLAGSAFNGAALTNISVNASNPYYDSRGNCQAVIEKQTNILVLGCSNSTIDATVVEIGPYAFAEMAIHHLTLPESVVRLGRGAFYGSSIKTITFEGNLLSIPDDCFRFCYGLVNFTIPNSVTSVGNSAFERCLYLETVTIPDSVTSLGESCFDYCIRLKEIEIPSSINVIPATVFYHCRLLAKVTLHEGLTAIGRYAFAHCEKLARIVIPLSVTTMADGVFNECSILNIYALAPEKPSGWNEYFNNSNCPIYWYSETANYDGHHWYYDAGVPTVWTE